MPISLPARITAALSAALALATPVAAQNGPPGRGFVALGAGIAPDYLGSNDYTLVPLLVGRIRTDVATLGFRGLSVSADFLAPRSGGRFSGGIEAGYRFGRGDVADARIDALPDIPGAVEVGAFAGYTFRGVLAPRDRLGLSVRVRTDVNGAYNGLTVTPRARYDFALSRRLRANLSLQARFADAGFAQTYFGISAAGAAASGLAAYTATGGLYSVGASWGLDYAMGRNWGIGARVGYARLVGSAAASPVVATAGSTNQVFGGLSVSIRF